MIELLNQNSGAIQAIMVIVLVIVTTLYMLDTKRIANITKRQLLLFTNPVAVIGESIGLIVQMLNNNPLQIAPITDWVSFEFKIKNIGNVPIKYITTTSFNEHDSLSGHESILYPGQILTHRTETYRINPIPPTKITGIAYIKIIYWALDAPTDKKFFSRKFQIKENAVGYDIIEDMAGNI